MTVFLIFLYLCLKYAFLRSESRLITKCLRLFGGHPFARFTATTIQIWASCPTGPTRHPLPEEPRKVTVRLKRGSWEVEITSAEDRLQAAVESVLAGMSSKEPMLVEAQDSDPQRKGGTSRSIIQGMWKEGWFSSPRALSEVHEEMSRRGYHYDRTAVAHTLVDLVREGSLFRDGSMRNYRYVQKYPFKEQA